MMNKLVRPYAIFLFVLLPQLLLSGYLYIGTTDVPQPILVLVLGVTLSASVYALLKGKEETVNTRFFIVISSSYAILLAYGFPILSNLTATTGNISPRLLFTAACMVTILYGLFGIASTTTSHEKGRRLTRYVAGSIIVPLLWFITASILGGSNLNTAVFSFIIAAVFAIMLLTAKMLFIKGLKKPLMQISLYPSKKNTLITAIVMLLLPLGGLTVNQMFGGWDSGGGGLFGDFSHPLYFIIAILNGMLLLIPPMEDKRLRLLLFYLKAAGYTYILYFFVIFFPVLPIGAVGIIFYGLGLLAWAPLMAALWQGMHMVREWQSLLGTWGSKRIIIVFLTGILTLPVCLSLVFWGDKANFNEAVKYLQQQPEQYQPINLNRLERTLKHMQGDFQPSRDFIAFSDGRTPILSGFYSKFVLDGRSVSQNNIMALENLFFDRGHYLMDTGLSDPQLVNRGVRLQEAVSETVFDEHTGVYRTWVHLKLKNPTDAGNGEYVTTFRLPTGVYVSDYYLDVFGTRKPGILTDRRAALFIYQKIVNTRQDPGLLHYIGKNTLELRVFPFEANEVRDTGFEIIHQQQFDLILDHMTIQIDGDAAVQKTVVDGGVLLTPQEKIGLEQAVRLPKYYFIIDGSQNSDVSWHISQIEAFRRARDIDDAEVIFASYRLDFHNLSDMSIRQYKTAHGYNLGLALRHILSQERGDIYPVIIAVSDNMHKAVFPQNIYPLADKYPESPYYYRLNHNLTLTPYGYEDNIPGDPQKDPVVIPALRYNSHYVSGNEEMELVLTGMPGGFFPSGNQYIDAVQLDVLQQSHLMYGNADSLDLVRSSFRTRILSPQTAFIVVETVQQEIELLALQEQLLSNNQDAPLVSLDEPSLLLCILLTLMFFILMKSIKRKYRHEGVR